MGATTMKTLNYNEVMKIYEKYLRIEAMANSICLDVNTRYLKEKISKMKDLLRGFSLFASQVSKAMTTIADDIKEVLIINKDITKNIN